MIAVRLAAVCFITIHFCCSTAECDIPFLKDRVEDNENNECRLVHQHCKSDQTLQQTCIADVEDERKPGGGGDLAVFQFICVFLVSFLIPLVFIGTVLDAIFSCGPWKVTKRELEFWNRLIIWSLYRNFKSLVSSKGGAYPFLNGIRVLCAYWILVGHTFSFPVVLNTEGDEGINIIKELRKNRLWTPIENFTLAVDTFFFIGGFLLFNSTWKILKKNNGKINAFVFLLRKHWRLTIGTIILMIYVTIDYLLLRSETCFFNIMLFFKQTCRYKLWVNLLFVQNYWPAMEMCGPQTWFLAVLFQYHILGLFIVYIIYRKRNLGIVIGNTLLVSFMTVTYLILNRNSHNFEDAEETEKSALMKLENCRVLVYHLPFDHFGPYWFGMITCHLTINCHYQSMKKEFKCCAWIISFVCLVAVVFSCHLSNTTHFRFLYESLHRTMWGIGLIWIVYACATGNGGMLNNFLSWKPFLVLGNVTFLFYLIHPLIVLRDCCHHKGPYPFQVLYWVYRTWRSTAISLCVALLCHIGIERPALKWEETILKGK